MIRQMTDVPILQKPYTGTTTIAVRGVMIFRDPFAGGGYLAGGIFAAERHARPQDVLQRFAPAASRQAFFMGYRKRK